MDLVRIMKIWMRILPHSNILGDHSGVLQKVLEVLTTYRTRLFISNFAALKVNSR